MATFITTIIFTDQGEKNIQETTKRAASFKATAKKMGVKVVGQYWTLGEFDGLMIYDAPDEETATALMLHLGSLDNVHRRPCGRSSRPRWKRFWRNCRSREVVQQELPAQ